MMDIYKIINNNINHSPKFILLAFLCKFINYFQQMQILQHILSMGNEYIYSFPIYEVIII